jgi:hypothetical protein
VEILGIRNFDEIIGAVEAEPSANLALDNCRAVQRAIV